MKVITFSLLLIMALTVGHATGQTLNHRHKTKTDALISLRQNKLFNQLLVLQPVEHKKMRGGSRLIAQAGNDYIPSVPPVYEPSDSTHYYYKSNYGYDPTSDFFSLDISAASFYDYQQNYFDSSLYWIYAGAGNYTLSDSTVCSFSTNHHIKTENKSSLLSNNFSSSSYTYDANDRRVSQLDSSIYGVDTTKDLSTFFYDASGKLIYGELKFWDTASLTWIPEMADSIFYDINSNLSKIIIYQYDTLNAVWFKYLSYSFSYSGTNQLTQTLVQAWDTMSQIWINNFKTDYVSNGTNQVISTTGSYWDAASWIYQNQDSFQYSSGPYPAIKTSKYWDAMASLWINSEKYEFNYNAFNQFSSYETSFWDGMSSTWHLSTNNLFYYEAFTPQEIDESELFSNKLLVYPVPVANKVVVETEWDEIQPCVITLCDMTGNVLLSIDLPSSKRLKKDIDLSSLPSGSYILSVKGEKNNSVQKIIKQ
ncbi:hypothetical protein EMGBS15_10200 [Filimonas sp.]|nr:hypothetical protein EMGBS15_10200 [Filimonas sp.]